MRVIAGKAKRLQLKTLPGLDTRPTTDRIKETLFNMIQSEIYDVNFLDLFAGSGGIGIEALSRGAKYAVFVDSNRKAVDIIKDNLNNTHLSEQSEVLNMTAEAALKRLSGKYLFDVVFMDPPYNKGLEIAILNNQNFYDILSDNALIIIEASLETVINPDIIPGFRLNKEKIYKTNKHIFLEREQF